MTAISSGRRGRFVCCCSFLSLPPTALRDFFRTEPAWLRLGLRLILDLERRRPYHHASRQTVFIVDEDAASRQHVLAILHSHGILACAGASFAALCHDNDESHAGGGCLLLDIAVMAQHEHEWQSTMAGCTSLPVLLMCARPSTRIVVEGIKHGALDFLEKPIEPDALLTAVRKAFESNRKAWAAEDTRQQRLRRIEQLSNRERQVYNLLIQGLANKQVAWEL